MRGGSSIFIRTSWLFSGYCWAQPGKSRIIGAQRAALPLTRRYFATSRTNKPTERTNSTSRQYSSEANTPKSSQSSPTKPQIQRADHPPSNWDENPDLSISAFSELPYSDFGVNQHMVINEEFKEALRQILWQFRAPIRYAFAYGSGVFPQVAQSPTTPSSELHPHASKAIKEVQGGSGKMIDFIFGVSYTQHWHSINLQQHRSHYSAAGSLGSYVVSRIQDSWGAGVYFNTHVTVNGTLIKYGVVNLDTLCNDLSTWSTLYIAGRLQKPVKILRDDPRVRLANQINLLSAVRTALLLLPPDFTEKELYSVIAGISYLGDPRMAFPTENPRKVANIVENQLPNFRRLYAPLIENLPNVSFKDAQISDPGWSNDPSSNANMQQDMNPIPRGNMVRRLPQAFRKKLYFAYQSKFQIPQLEFNKMLESSEDEDGTRFKRREGGPFEQRIASDGLESLKKEVGGVIRKTIRWPSISQTIKGPVTGGFSRTWRYLREKRDKYLEGRKSEKELTAGKPADDKAGEKKHPSP